MIICSMKENAEERRNLLWWRKLSGNPLMNDLEARRELPRQSLSCIRVGTLVGLSLLCLAGTGTHSRPSQTTSRHIPSWHLCMSIPADLSDPGVGYRRATLVPV